MRLHELVGLRNGLQNSIDLGTIKNELLHNKFRIEVLANSSNDYYKIKLAELANNHYNRIETFNEDLEKTKEILNIIKSDIDKLTQKFFTQNYQTECLWNDPNEIRKHKVLVMAPGSKEVLISRIQLHSTWKYPALEIGCRDGEYTKFLVSSDPLYISDLHQCFIDETARCFTPEYQNRLCKYLITNDFKIQGLPNGQIGFIFSHNFFNYLSLDSIKQMLLQAMSWLRPGGVMLFTYNNADLSASAGMCEDYFMTYVPKSILIPLVESVGFEIIDSVDLLPSTSWIEFKKPGNLSSIKAHQVLGEIRFK